MRAFLTGTVRFQLYAALDPGITLAEIVSFEGIHGSHGSVHSSGQGAAVY